MDKRKKNIVTAIAAALLVITAAVYPFVLSRNATYTVVIKDENSRYYTGRALLIMGNHLVVTRDTKDHANRYLAVNRPGEERKTVSIDMRTIRLIEIIPDVEETTGDYPSGYLGTYAVNASGHRGYLLIQYKNDRLYGTIRFPKWAKGAYEPCKGIRITGNRIYFTRSVTSVRELRRVGATTYFTQQYSGTYYNNGKYIKGFYLRDGGKFMWEATKIQN